MIIDLWAMIEGREMKLPCSSIRCIVALPMTLATKGTEEKAGKKEAACLTECGTGALQFPLRTATTGISGKTKIGAGEEMHG